MVHSTCWQLPELVRYVGQPDCAVQLLAERRPGGQPIQQQTMGHRRRYGGTSAVEIRFRLRSSFRLSRHRGESQAISSALRLHFPEGGGPGRPTLAAR